MSRRRPKRCSSDPRRGRHRKATSPETAAWEDGHLIPKRPPWMSPATYRGLADLRRSL